LLGPPLVSHHHRAWSYDRQLLFRDPFEALVLWGMLVAAFPELEALSLMPDHIHLVLPHSDPEGRLFRVESGYARWRNHHRGETGPVFARHPVAQEIPAKQRARVERYVLLNACRARLVTDPLAWPWSTHRDRLGLAVDPVVPIASDPVAFHRYVSGDPSAGVAGTPLPKAPFSGVTWPDVASATCAVSRCRASAIRMRTPARTLAIRAAWYHGIRDPAELSRLSGLRSTQIYQQVRLVPEKGAAIPDPALAAVLVVLGDRRFNGLETPLFARTAFDRPGPSPPTFP
jgi:hypothetical protein